MPSSEILPSPSYQADRDVVEPIAIVGFSVKFPGEAKTSEDFWQMISEKNCASKLFPKDRMNVDAFYHPDGTRPDSVPVRHAHFLEEDLGAFDAPFFSLTPSEAMSMDPQHRGLLETAYRALENAGIPLEKIDGTKAGVFTGTFTDDYRIATFKDAAAMPKHAAIGVGQNFSANRLSWAFNLKGPSLQIDTACSSSLIALDLACQSLRNRDSSIALVGGASVISSIETTMSLSNMGFLSPNGRCFSFDERGNGYARGEGFGVLIIKLLSDAIQDGDSIRAVVRSSGSNQNGRNRSITQTSKVDQVQLMRDTYAKAGLDLATTRFVEAHGTGTAVGDPNEANAIGEVFGQYRTPEQPLYVGAVKSNIGHLEGASGIAGVVKAVLALEKGVIPPNTNFKRLHPRIKAKAHNLEFPTLTIPWPDAIRRASVNSFGFGGSNAHVVMDDALSYLHSRGLQAHHCTISHPPASLTHGDVNGDDIAIERKEGPRNAMLNGMLSVTEEKQPRLLVFSAFNDDAVKRVVKSYSAYFAKQLNKKSLGDVSYVNNLAYTLYNRRTRLPCRSVALVDHVCGLPKLDELVSKPNRSSSKLGLGFVFTGQGAQYAGMGKELLRYTAFRDTFLRFGSVLSILGCEWSLFDELLKEDDVSRIHEPEFSQPICTALQISLVQLLQSYGIHPATVVGHSSGEIAAAYTAGALSFDSACKVAYFRGKLTASLCHSGERNGGMLAVGLSEPEVEAYLKRLHPKAATRRIVAACINSPKSVTVSGDLDQIDGLKAALEKDGIFNRKLRVDVAYHSKHMEAIASHYADSLQDLAPGSPSSTTMVSSVTGKIISADELCSKEYWVRNLVSPVRFSDAISALAVTPSSVSSRKSYTQKQKAPQIFNLVEIGPHSTLQGPIRDTLAGSARGNQINYTAAIKRNTQPIETLLSAVGSLWCQGYEIDISAVNEQKNKHFDVLTDLPEYPFDHSQSYLHKPRLQKDFLGRDYPRLDLLGSPVVGFNPLEPAWRKFIRISETPWIEDHKVNGAILYPAAGMLVMAIEAAKLMAPPNKEAAGFMIKEASFDNSLAIPANDQGVEVQLHLRPLLRDINKVADTFQFTLCSYSDDRWVRNCHGTIEIRLAENDAICSSSWHWFDIGPFEDCKRFVDKRKVYEHFQMSGFHYGPAFQGLNRIHYDTANRALADVELFPWGEQEEANHAQDHIIHPTTLDALAQLALVGLTDGAREVPPINLPTGTKNLWISSRGLSHPGSALVKAFADTKFKSERQNEFSITAVDYNTGEVLLSWACLETTNIGRADTTEMDRKKQMCYQFDLKPDIDLMDMHSARNYCTINQDQKEKHRDDLEIYMVGVIKRVLHELSDLDISTLQRHHQKYLMWIRKRLEDFKATASADQLERLDDDQDHLDLRDRIRRLNGEGRFYSEVGSHVLDVLRGAADPLAILFEGDLARDLYQDLNLRISGSLSRLVELLAHKNPNMKIAEIGAGTGGTTSVILDSLVHGTTSRFSQYDYTDISASFFESAKGMFETYAPKIRFKTFDVEQDPIKQGFQLGSYDLLIAANVLHATQSLEVTLRNVHTLLKPGGKLVLIEVTNNLQKAGFGMGLLPGWWLSTEDFRTTGPCMPENRWDDILRQAGFSGLDVALRDSTDDAHYEQSILVSTSKASYTSTEGSGNIIVLAQNGSEKQKSMATEIQNELGKFHNVDCVIRSIEALEVGELHQAFCISLLELEEPVFADIGQESFSCIQKILTEANAILWISTDTNKVEDKSKFRMIDGLRRVVVSENCDTRFVTVALEESSIGERSQAQRIVQLYEDTVSAAFGNFEEEYTERDGILCIKRMIEASEINQHLEKQTAPLQVEERLFRDVPSLRLEFESPGVLDSLLFVEDPTPENQLGEGEVMVEVKGVGVNFRDCLIALGRMKDSMKTIGFELSGVVTKVGFDTEFKVGDRVYGLCPSGCFSTFAIVPGSLLVKIPEGISFKDAAGLPTGLVTAYYSLIDVARLRSGETVLIHSASGGTGQLAIQIAQHLGATIFVTVGTEEKKQLMIQKYHIPEDHVFSSRSIGFASHLMRLTNGRGVDVVLNSLSDEKLAASWECMAPLGRFVEIGKKDVFANSKLSMLPFAKNVSFTVVDMFGLAQERPNKLKAILQRGDELVRQYAVWTPQPVHVYGVGHIEEAFRYMQSGQNMGKIIIDMRHNELVKAIVRSPLTWMFDPNASYVLAGGFGGILRSTARWIASRGGRNLIILSRSGVRPGKSADLVGYLESQGVRIAAPRCDVSNTEEVAAALRSCKEDGMPPIKGCIQGSMVLRDALFEKMSQEDWSTTVKPRVQGTWNLHKLLPHGMDFFVMLSSVTGIVGSAGQANYAASNNYMDAFARYRVNQGEKATSLDLGWVESEGIVAETEGLARQWIVAGCWIPVSQPDLFGLLDYYCDPNLKIDSSSVNSAQILIGLGPPAMVHAKGISDLPDFMNRPMFRYLHQMELDDKPTAGSSSEGAEIDHASLFRGASNNDEAAEHVVDALVRRVAKAMAMPTDDIDSRKPLHAYGVDSLLAIELRTWFRKYFGVDIAVFELIGAKDFLAVAERVARIASAA
ncbi:reducing type I polyketide synthase [Lindgomyces ingoldianus]|uniref:Reducing type I polyketide synthase n=1 Tax=Lindgomyces ingoldianus TaxID=673940 RepID=A0ACB6QAE8_9PLEO|nr:reducing type I polyketide synthase [Lindgomyces ingoldianus]KAF2463891.1 reducing type I polyketide synthase [Lindgomyces ingoldianus]